MAGIRHQRGVKESPEQYGDERLGERPQEETWQIIEELKLSDKVKITCVKLYLNTEVI